MYISNVGDSRAIVISATSDGRFVAKPMSSDQTPYRKDERERIKKTGARVLSMDQIEGIEPLHENWGEINLGEDIDEGGDPPRVWAANANFPGTAFTRSLGDLFAEECGVYADPEILERYVLFSRDTRMNKRCILLISTYISLYPHACFNYSEIRLDDKYIVLASDGVFEFLTNQMVADIIVRYDDPLEACKQVVSTAYNMWLQYEVRTDDITIVCFFIDNMRRNSVFGDTAAYYSSGSISSSPQTGSGLGQSPPSERRPSLVDAAHAAVAAQAAAELAGEVSSEAPEEVVADARPVRRVMSRAKKNMIQIQSADDSDAAISPEEIRALKTPKTKIEAEVITSAVKNNFLFQHLSLIQRNAIIEVMRRVPVKKGDFIIKQGDRGDLFYVVDSGRFEVRVIFPGQGDTKNIDENDPETAGNAVHMYESGPDNHPGFGELSLM